MPAALWTPELIRKAVSEYLDCGNYAEVGRRMNIDGSTILKWSTRPEWAETQQILEAELDATYKARLRKAVGSGLDRMLERIEGGDVRLTKEGQLVDVPVTLRDLALASGLALDKLRLLDGKPSRLTATASLALQADQYREIGRTVATGQDLEQGEGQTQD